MNSQTQDMQFSFPPQRHQGQRNQSIYPSYQPTIVAPKIYGFPCAPTTQHTGFYYAPQGPGINLSRAGAGAVTGGAQHVESPLPGGRGAAVVQQGGIQQPPQQTQPLQAMALPLGQTDVYQGHNGGGQNLANNTARNRKHKRSPALMDIIDPTTGKNISEEIYDDDAAPRSDDSTNRAASQPQLAPPEQQCSTRKIKRSVDNQLMLSLREDIAIRKTQSPDQGESSDLSEEDSTTNDLYKRVQRTLNNMHNHTEKNLRDSVDLIFEKAVNEPNFISVCALLCKKFARTQVTVPIAEVGNKEHIINFQSLIIRRCLLEFEDARDKNREAILKHGIGASETSGLDGYWQTLTAEEIKSRTKSFRNVRFMGELFKQRIFTSFIVWECGHYLLTQIEDESLECFCKLLSSVGKDLESEDVGLGRQFHQISDIVNRKTPNNISPRVIRMLQSLIELRKNKWISPETETVGKRQASKKSSPQLHETNKESATDVEDKGNSKSKKEAQAPVLAPKVQGEQHSGIVNLKDQEKDEVTPTGPPPLEYTHSADQQSPLNLSGRIVYDQGFLIALRTKPSSKIRPFNLPDENCVLKDNSGPLAPKRGNQQGNPKKKLTKQNVIKVSLSLGEDAELRGIENGGNSFGTMKPEGANEEEIKTESLYEKFRTILDTLISETFKTSRDRIRELQIDSMEKLQYLIDLVCEKAIDNPDYYGVYALTCKELARVHFSGSDTRAGKKEGNVNFRKLFILRPMEFEKNTVDENARAIKRKEIEVCPDQDEKKELLHILNEEERKIRVKSVGNIRFIGELFHLGMLTTDIMHRSISHLLTQIDEESLEHLCKLLIVIGKDLESGGQSLDGYFEQMLEFVNRKGPMKASLRARFSLQYLTDLRSNNWISIVDGCNPKTLDKTATKSIIKSPDVKVNNTPTNIAREDKQNNEGEGFNITEKKVHFHLPQIELQGDLPTKQKNKYKKDDSRPTKECELKPITSVDTSEVENKSPIADDLRSDNKNTLTSSRTVSVDASKIVTPNKFAELKNPPGKQDESALPISGSFNVHLAHRTAIIIEEYLSCTGDTSIRNTALTIRETYDDVTFVNFVREVLNSVVQKSAIARKRVGQLMMHLISVNILPLHLYLAGLTEVLDKAEDLVIYIPKIWVYLAELIWYPLAEGVHPFGELKTIMASLKNKGLAGELMVELTIRLVDEKTPKWIKDKWDQSGLQWRDFLPEGESTDFVEKFDSDFLVVVSRSTSSRSMKSQLSMEEIREQLNQLMSHEKEESLTDIIKWISVHVGERVIESEFVKVLMTAILETSIEPYNEKWQFRVDKYRYLRALIPRYIDVSIKLSELQFLISIQEYKDQLEHPQSMHLQTIEKQTIESIVSFDVFDLLENNDNRRPVNRKLLAILALKSFFTSLKGMWD